MHIATIAFTHGQVLFTIGKENPKNKTHTSYSRQFPSHHDSRLVNFDYRELLRLAADVMRGVNLMIENYNASVLI